MLFYSTRLRGDGEKMEENLDGVAPCSSLAVEAIIRVGAAGAIWGLCAGPYDARQQGLTGIAKASFVANTVRSFGIRCGFVAGVFSITRCGVQKYRGRNDWLGLCPLRIVQRSSWCASKNANKRVRIGLDIPAVLSGV
ncbi:hypothetical protein ACSQ67_014654 [Phaseolus vulgaris]